MRSTLTSFVPPTLGMLRTISRGWMQKPVRPTSCDGKAEIAEQLGDARHERDDARVAAGDGMLGADRVDEPAHYMFRRYSPPTA